MAEEPNSAYTVTLTEGLEPASYSKPVISEVLNHTKNAFIFCFLSLQTYFSNSITAKLNCCENKLWQALNRSITSTLESLLLSSQKTAFF